MDLRFCPNQLVEELLKLNEDKELSVPFGAFEYVMFIIYTSEDVRNKLDIQVWDSEEIEEPNTKN